MLRRLLGHQITQNALALYGLQLSAYVLPIVTVPFLARVLRPEGWGEVIYAQSYGMWIGAFLEYGFTLSGTRDIARNRGDREKTAEIVSSVSGGSGLLASLAILATFVVGMTVPAFRHRPDFLWISLLGGFALGFSPVWYFQGVEKLWPISIVSTTLRLIGTVAIFVFVRNASQGLLVLILQVATNVLVSFILQIWMYHEIPLRRPRLSASIRALKEGLRMFVFRWAFSLYTLANVFILGLFTSIGEVAFYGGPERIARAMIGMITPISIALYPRMSELINRDAARARELAKVGLLIMVGISTVLMFAVQPFAPLAIRLLLGKDYDRAVPVFRVLTLLLPLTAVANVMGVQWMVPLGLEGLCSKIMLSAGFLNIVTATLLAPRFGAAGMAWSVILAESLVVAAMFVVLARSGRFFWMPNEGAGFR